MVPLASVKFLPYWTQLDMNFLKVFNVGSWRYEARWEFFNMMNNGVELENTFNHSGSTGAGVPVPVGWERAVRLLPAGSSASRSPPASERAPPGPSLISGRGPTLLPPGSGESSSPAPGFFVGRLASLQAVDEDDRVVSSDVVTFDIAGADSMTSRSVSVKSGRFDSLLRSYATRPSPIRWMPLQCLGCLRGLAVDRGQGLYADRAP